jgi:hypothetical protein
MFTYVEGVLERQNLTIAVSVPGHRVGAALLTHFCYRFLATLLTKPPQPPRQTLGRPLPEPARCVDFNAALT